MRFSRIVLIIWLAWFGSIVLMWSMYRLRVMHPHFLPLTSLLTLQVIGGLAVLIGGVWYMVRGPRRLDAAAWMLLGITPLWLWAAHMTYGIWRSQSRYVPMDIPLKLAGAGGAALVDAAARFRYPDRFSGDKAVMVHRDVPLPEKQVAAMDQHICRLEELLGRRCKTKVHWVRGGLLGFEGRYFQGLALGSPSVAQPNGDDGLTDLDRHEVAHFVLHHHCGPDSEPPSLLVEGWAEAQSGYESGVLAQRAWQWKQKAPPFTLRELTDDDWYCRMMWPVYVQGGPLVDFVLREYGAEKFFQLYVGCRRKSFAADCERILGVDLDQLDRLYWADVEKQIAAIEPEKDNLFNAVLAEGVDVNAWRRFATSYLATKTNLLASPERIQLDVEIQTEWVGENGKSGASSFQMQTAHEGPHHRCVRHDSEGSEAIVASPKQSFVLRKPGGAAMWTLDRTRSLGFAKWDYGNTLDWIRDLENNYLKLHDIAFRRLSSSEDCSVVGFRELEEDDGKAVEITFDQTPQFHRDALRTRIELRLAGDNTWAVHSLDRRIHGDDGESWSKEDIDYQKGPDGVPLVKQIVEESSDPHSSVTSTTRVEWRQSTIPESEFTLDAFGINSSLLSPRYRPPWYLVLSCVGAAASLALGLILVLRARRMVSPSLGDCPQGKQVCN